MLANQLNRIRSCAACFALVVATCSALVVTANAQGRTGPRGLNACDLIRDASLAARTLDSHTRHKSNGSTWLSCEYTDIAPGTYNLNSHLDVQWRVGFGFVPYTSIAEAQKSWQETYGKWQGKTSESASSTSSVSRLRGYGADDAFIVETTTSEPGSREAMVYWRKGRWVGTLQLRAPLDSKSGGVEDAQFIMKELKWAAFGK